MTGTTIKVTVHNSGIRTIICILSFSKLTQFMRTIPLLGELLKPLEEVIRLFNFIPAVTGKHLCSVIKGMISRNNNFGTVFVYAMAGD